MFLLCVQLRQKLRRGHSAALRCAHTKRHYERVLLPFSQKQVFAVVANVNDYKLFVPWVKGSTVFSTNISGNDGVGIYSDTYTTAGQRNSQSSQVKVDAELEVGFGVFTEKYVSRVVLTPDTMVTATSSQTNLFDKLVTEWKFSPAKDPRSCWVTFLVDFQFKSAMYNKLSEAFLNDVATNMVKAFSNRCADLYGKPQR